ncbi:Tetratricopeptide repeat-containing protein [Cladophialophora immunda]|nr:Tetratricopeptide repeat-containing protein [Cladophialophora immunda]
MAMTPPGSEMTDKKKTLRSDFLWVDSSGGNTDPTNHVYEREVRSHVQRWSKTHTGPTRLRNSTSTSRKRKAAPKVQSVQPVSSKPIAKTKASPPSASRTAPFTAAPMTPVSSQETPVELEDLVVMQTRSRSATEVESPPARRSGGQRPLGDDVTVQDKEDSGQVAGTVVPATWRDDQRWRQTIQSRIQQTVRLWHSIAPALAATVDSDRLEKMVRCHHLTFSTVCSVKKAATTRESQEEALRFERLMVKGCRALEAYRVGEAFVRFDEAFSYLKPILILQNIRGQPMLCRLIAQFSGPLFVPLWHRVYQYIIELAEVLISPDNPFGQSADLFIRSPVPLADASEMVLRCILDVVQTQLGPLHPDALDSLECLAWSLFERGRGQEALARFTELLQNQEAARGPMSPEACDALRGLAETHLRLGDLDVAEHMFDEVLGWRSMGPGRESPQASAVRVKCLLSLSRLAQRRQNPFRARWLLRHAAQTASLAYSEGGQTATDVSFDAKPPELDPLDEVKEEVQRLLDAVGSWSIDSLIDE